MLAFGAPRLLRSTPRANSSANGRFLLWGVGVALLLLVAALPAAGQLSGCRLIDKVSVGFTPDQPRYDIDDRVTIEARLQNFDTADYNLSLFSVLNNPVWSTSADGALCGPAPADPSASCAFDARLLYDASGKSPVLHLQRRQIVITTGTGNNTTTTTSFGEMPKDLTILVSGRVPPISIQEERSFLRIRQERDGTELCEVVRETREITSAVLGSIEQCLRDGTDAIGQVRRLIDRDARDVGLRSADLRDEEDDLDRADRILGLARSDYEKLRAGTENQTILDNCNDAIRLAQKAERAVEDKIRDKEGGNFIWGTVVPVVIIIIVAVVALKFLGKRRWDRL